MKTFFALVVAGILAIGNAEVQPSEARVLRTAASGTGTSTTSTASTIGSVSSIAVSTINIAKGVAEIVDAVSQSKDCHQLACWVASPTYDCQFAAANWVQRELAKGRNAFGVESSGDSGMWVRYWRTAFYPPDQGDIAAGTCTDGTAYTVTNCQATEGKVYC